MDSETAVLLQDTAAPVKNKPGQVFKIVTEVMKTEATKMYWVQSCAFYEAYSTPDTITVVGRWFLHIKCGHSYSIYWLTSSARFNNSCIVGGKHRPKSLFYRNSRNAVSVGHSRTYGSRKQRSPILPPATVQAVVGQRPTPAQNYCSAVFSYQNVLYSIIWRQLYAYRFIP